VIPIPALRYLSITKIFAEFSHILLANEIHSISGLVARVYFKASETATRAAADSSAYDKATLYVWNNDTCGGYAETDEGHDDWGTGIKPTGVDDKFGAYWDLQVRSEATQCINFIPRVDGAKPLGDFDAKLDLTQTGKNNF